MEIHLALGNVYSPSSLVLSADQMALWFKKMIF